MWTPMAIRKIVMSPKKITAWTTMEAPLVCIFPNSTTLFPPGIWNSSPGVNSTNSTTATITGPQSAISTGRKERNYMREWRQMVGCWKESGNGVRRGGRVWIQTPSLHNVSVLSLWIFLTARIFMACQEVNVINGVFAYEVIFLILKISFKRITKIFKINNTLKTFLNSKQMNVYEK